MSIEHNADDLLFEEQIQRELDLRFCDAIANAAHLLGHTLLTVDEDVAETRD